MQSLFYVSGAVAILATLAMLTRASAVHALLDLIVSLLAVALVFYSVGAPFAAALEVIIYAGAIMVLFLFVVILLNPAIRDPGNRKRDWAVPSILTVILIAELIFVLHGAAARAPAEVVEPKQVGIALFGPYLIGVELASILLLAGLVGAFHIGERVTQTPDSSKDETHGTDTHERRADTGSDLVLAGTQRPSRTP
jgi:NADH-quinone oxidoreductase subunit J